MHESLWRLFLSEVPKAPLVGEPMTDEKALRWALAQAFQAYGFTSPNPAVGCVILDRNNRFLSAGHTHPAGGPHAEADALANLVGKPLPRGSDGWDISAVPKEKLEGAKVFVTLEPCAHEGRTPSCAITLAKLPIKEVTAILQDPFPKVAGKGFEILRQAGMQVRCLEHEGNSPEVEMAKAACEMFLTNTNNNRPFVSLKVATSLDGMMALKNGESQWITGADARNFARYLRGAHDACLVGRQTILQDDPMLDARETPFATKTRYLVILDSQGSVLQKPELKIFKAHKPENILVCVGPGVSVTESPLAQIIKVQNPKQALPEVLKALWDRQIRSVWIEGGASALSSALEAGFGDRLWLFQGPYLLGAKQGRSWTESWGIAQMKERLEIVDPHILALGQDQLTTGRLSKAKS